MPHRSRGDPDATRREDAVCFWSGALGRERAGDDGAAARYAHLATPSGHVFCVIPMQTDTRPEGALA